MNTKVSVRNENKAVLLYPDLSYQVLGASFDVFNSLGWGHKESYYQRALAARLDSLGIRYEKEIIFPVVYQAY